jgi:hypothetical protein
MITQSSASIVAVLLSLSLCVADSEGPSSSASKSFEVPYRLSDTFHVVIRAKIDGKGPLNFILDTGAPALFVTTSAAQALDIKPDKNGWARLEDFEIEGGVRLRGARARIETPFQLEGMNGLGLAGSMLHGIIGQSVLARYRVELDLSNDKMTWTALDYRPQTIPGLFEGGRSSAGGLEGLGAIMKLIGTFLGKASAPETALQGFWGIQTTDLSKTVTVTGILHGSPASEAGLQIGDRITHVDGKPVGTSEELQKRAAKLKAGQRIQLELERGGQQKHAAINLGAGF